MLHSCRSYYIQPDSASHNYAAFPKTPHFRLVSVSVSLSLSKTFLVTSLSVYTSERKAKSKRHKNAGGYVDHATDRLSISHYNHLHYMVERPARPGTE
jgi:hypothetical protein